jgi:hypothetical protein
MLDAGVVDHDIDTRRISRAAKAIMRFDFAGFDMSAL